MGLSFHYSGSIAKPELLPGLISEIEDIASIYNWKYQVNETEFPENAFGKPYYNQHIYGISFTPPGCETIPVSFLSNGRMSHRLLMDFYGKTETREEHEYLYMLSVKTQFAGAESHQFIMELFRYLNTKYFSGFELTDEGKYWETRDVELLRSNFKRNADLINSVSSVTECFPKLHEESTEAYVERLIKLIQQRKNL
jgi:hypothetical protein